MTAEREDHVDFRADALHQATDLRQIAPRVEVAVHRANQVHARFCAGSAFRRLRHHALLQPVLGPEPVQCAIGCLPLVLVNGSRQEPHDVRAFRCHATADHLGDAARHDDGGQLGIERGVRATHRAFGAVLPKLLFGQAGDDDRQLVRRQCIGVVQHRRHRQILAAHRTVDDDLQSLDRGERVHRTPVAASAIMIEDEHQAISSALRCRATFARWRL